MKSRKEIYVYIYKMISISHIPLQYISIGTWHALKIKTLGCKSLLLLL